MIQGLCRVCGSGLTPPMAVCPTCATPHHADCWEYNRGCSIYGCRGPQGPAVASVTLLDGPSGARKGLVLEPVTIGLGAALIATIGGLGGIGPALCAAVAVGGMVAARQPQPELEPVESVVNLELERKAVSGLLGCESADQLAQTYALFEQRHPTLTLDEESQAHLALELLAAGHRAMGLTALDKALAQRGLDDKRLLEERRNIYTADPASVVEGVTGPLGPALGFTGLEDHTSLLRRWLDREPEPGRWWLLALSPRGWPARFQTPVHLPGLPATDPPLRSGLVAGPFSPAEAREAAYERWEANQPSLMVPESALELAPGSLEVTAAHLSQKAAVFQTPAGERAYAWEEVHAVVLAWLDTVKLDRQIVVESHYEGGQRSVVSRTLDVEHVHSRPILEVHVGAGWERLRLDTAHPELFDYLGRRREASRGTNVAIVARDLARFAPAARISHGLTCLLTGRTGPAQHFPDLRRIEEYIRWHHATGSPPALAAWRPVWQELVNPP